MRALCVVALLLLPLPLAAQRPAADDAFLDPVARRLVERARSAREELGRSVTSYTATIRSRSAAMLRLPLKDRLLHRSEMAARVRWSRDGETVVQLLAARRQSAGEVKPGRGFVYGRIFDPTSDRVYFGRGLNRIRDDGEEHWIVHPLSRGSERSYRYQSGDTMQIRLPDRRTIRAVELRVLPRTISSRYLTATLWIEPETGALVQAVYRPARKLDVERDSGLVDADDREDLNKVPGLFKPIQADLESVVIQYSLWNMKHWLPRLMRTEGYVRAGAVRVPFTDELSYRIHSVTDETDAADTLSAEQVIAAWSPDTELKAAPPRDGSRVRIYAPEDRTELLHGGELPPPIWEAAPEFASDEELEALVKTLSRPLPRGVLREPPRLGLAWGLAAADLVRYNRVEGLSVGARATADHPVARADATLRLGIADLHPNVEVELTVPRRRGPLSLQAYHRLASVDPSGDALGLGNSLNSLLFARDDGEYYRTTGGRVAIRPDAADRPWYRWSVFAERHEAVQQETDWSLARLVSPSRRFRPNVAADEGAVLGTSLLLTRWWGHEPGAPQGGVELLGEAATGDFHFARARVVTRGALPLGARHRVGLEAGGGTSWGSAPTQFHWFLGGPETLRGYAGSSATGTSFVRARADVARTFTNGALVLFSDAAWAGEREALDPADALLSAGVGASLLDGLLRADLARALRGRTGWRLEIYMDGVL